MAALGEIVRLALHYTQPGAGDIMNVFHFKIAGTAPSDVDLLEDLGSWIFDEWGARWVLMAATVANLSHFECDIVALDGTVTRNIGGGIVDMDGTVSADVVPAGVASYLLAYTAIPKARGSKYVPGGAETEVQAGEWSAGYLADLALLLGIYLTPFIGGSGVTLTPGVASLTLGTFVPFLVSGAIDTLAAYQRRRKAGVGI